jgi:xanthosine utilization system XapX-like protein
MNPADSFLLQQIGYASPALLVYLAGVVLAIIFIRKYPMPALITLCGGVVLLITTVVLTLIQYYLFRYRLENAWSAAEYSRVLSRFTLAANIVRALGLSLWLAAVFVGRRKQAAT